MTSTAPEITAARERLAAGNLSVDTLLKIGWTSCGRSQEPAEIFRTCSVARCGPVGLVTFCLTLIFFTDNIAQSDTLEVT